MGVIKGMLREEYERLLSLLEKYNNEVSRLPKGSLSVKEIRGRRYAYIARRINGKVNFKYIGRDSSKEVQRIAAEIHKRTEYKSKIRAVKRDIKELERALGGRKI